MQLWYKMSFFFFSNATIHITIVCHMVLFDHSLMCHSFFFLQTFIMCVCIPVCSFSPTCLNNLANQLPENDF